MPVNKTHARALTFAVTGALLLGGCDSNAKEGMEPTNPGPQEMGEAPTSNAAKHAADEEHTNPGPAEEPEAEEHTNPGPAEEAPAEEAPAADG